MKAVAVPNIFTMDSLGYECVCVCVCVLKSASYVKAILNLLRKEKKGEKKHTKEILLLREVVGFFLLLLSNTL